MLSLQALNNPSMNKICKRCGISFLPAIRIMKYCIDCRYIRVAREAPPVKSRFGIITSVYSSSQKFNYLLRRRYSWIKRSAARRNLEFELTQDRLSQLMVEPCFYCQAVEYAFSVDRLDNNKGYLDDNTVACCRMCNSRKHKATADEFHKILEMRRLSNISKT